VRSLRDLESYLTIRAPFSGVITTRFVHPGALAGPNSRSATPLLTLEQNSRLRLVVAVPEAIVGGIVNGANVCFTVPAYPGRSFEGIVSRISHALDKKTRTMPVELDVENPGLQLAPGMYPEVLWPVRRAHASLLVPPSSIVTTNERTFVIRVKNGVTEWVSVNRGPVAGGLAEVYGPLQPGDLVVGHGTDQLRPGTRVKVQTKGI
ncbi:MAG TPA: efflux RND transporter periplasmic adaptor subunit, partial [Acidobacteriaceae bacterium]|nr:efflux RND transporter periplasmic adaptor subunit [Acidobacteriaceae bacterium]